MFSQTLPVRQTVIGVSSGAVSSFALSFINPVLSGSLIIACSGTDSTGITFNVADTVNGSYHRDKGPTGTNASAAIHSFQKSAIGTPTVTSTPSSSKKVWLVIMEVTGGLISGTVLDQTVNQSAPSTRNISSTATGTLSNAGEFVIVNSIITGSAQTWTAGSGYTLLTGGVTQQGVEYLITADTSAQTGTFTIDVAQAYQCALATYVPDPSVAYDQLVDAVSTDITVYSPQWSYSNGAVGDIKVEATGAIGRTHYGTTRYAYWNQNIFNNDHSSQVTLQSFGGAGMRIGPAVRVSGGNCYAAQFDGTSYNIVSVASGTPTTLIGGPQARTNNPGDIALLQVQGSTLSLLVNSILLKQVTDTTYTSGSPGINYNGNNPTGNVSDWFAFNLGANLLGQTITSSLGTIGVKVGQGLTPHIAFVVCTVGTITPSITYGVQGQTVTSIEGVLPPLGPTIQSYTITSSLGTITTSVTGNASYSFPSFSIGSTFGTITPNISYVLDFGAVNINLFSFTLTSTLGNIIPEVDYFPTAQTITSSEGTLDTTNLLSYTLGSLTVTSLEGAISAVNGNSPNFNLFGQAINSGEGIILPEADYALTAQTGTFTLGTITFSISVNPDVTLDLHGQNIFSSEGIIQAVASSSIVGIPNVVGQYYDDALLILQQEGVYDPSALTYFSDFPIKAVWVASDQPPSMVLEQLPPAGSDFTVNMPITLILSEFPVSVANP